LDESGLAENTIVMYTGDQGFYLGEHGLYDKRFMYEEGLRMPFLVRWPGQIEAGTVSDGMILNVDFAPTILASVGLEDLLGTQGRSFLSLLKGTIPDDWRTSMYYRYYYSHFETEPHYGVRTYDYKLIYYDQIDQWELYDLNKDRGEMNNLYLDTQYQQVVDDLKTELNRLRAELDDDLDDHGDQPNVGALAANPMHVSKDIDIGKGNNSLLFRFRTKVGGTLFSKCDIQDVPYSKGFKYEGFKTLCIRKGNLYFFNDFDDDKAEEIESNLTDDQWHTVALVNQGKYPRIYVDGQLVFEGRQPISADNPDHTFNIGAGIDTGGYRGYNFKGSLSQVLHYDKPLSHEAVLAFATGDIPEGGKIIFPAAD